MSKTTRKKRFQIEPNSISENEQEALRSVLSNFKNRSVSADSKTPQETSQPTESEELSKENLFGYPNSESLDIQTSFGYPNNENIDKNADIQSSFGYPKTLNPSNDGDSLDIQTQSLDIQKSSFSTNRISKKESLDIQTNQKKGKWLKYDKDRQRKGVFLRTDDDITQRFRAFCVSNNLELAQATEIAWQQFMDSLDIQKNDLDIQKNDLWISLNNKQLIMLFKTKNIIINLYCAYNQFFNKKINWTARDDRVASKFNDFDPRIIELGIIQTQANLLNEGNRPTINGFQYYTNEIMKFVVYEDNPELLNTILRINRENWKKATGFIVDLSFLENPENS